MIFSIFPQIDTNRFKVVYQDISVGSEPGARFYLFVGISTLIASFGLIANSTAVVIGAMLVAPLMTPIFGLSLALIRGDTTLFNHALRSETVGVLASIAMSWLLGFCIVFSNPFPEATPEMLARTSPNLYDLFVAVLSGFAGAYALVDEKISPALPGVAIATAIVPPLANSGLCLAYGAYHGALGSFLLFFANFLSILLVSSFVFVKAGMTRESEGVKKVDVLHRFGFAILCFFLIAIFLGDTLYEMAKDRRLYNSVRNILIAEFAEYPATDMKKLIVDTTDEKINILVEIQSPGQIAPDQVKAIEDSISKISKIPSNLIVRTIKSSDVSSSGSWSPDVAQTLDGFYISPVVSLKVRMIRIAEQVAKEFFNNQLDINLDAINYIDLPRGPAIVTMITGVRPLSNEKIRSLEDLLRTKTDTPDLNLVIRYIPVELYDREGSFRYGWSLHDNQLDQQEQKILKQLLSQIKTEFQNHHGSLLTKINRTVKDKKFAFLAEVDGNINYSKEDIIRLQRQLTQSANMPVLISLRINGGAVLTSGGLTPYNEFMESHLKHYDEDSVKIKKILKSQR